MSIKEGVPKKLSLLLDSGGVCQGWSLENLHVRLDKVVNQTWESGKVLSFIDDQGGGWHVDISSGFGGLMLYAVVRSMNGKRTVVDVIDESDLESLKPALPTNEPPIATENSPEVTMLKEIKDLRYKILEIEKINKELLGEIERSKGLRPADMSLLLWETTATKGIDSKSFSEKIENSQVLRKIQNLMVDGVSVIEVWTRMKKPKLSVELE